MFSFFIFIKIDEQLWNNNNKILVFTFCYEIHAKTRNETKYNKFYFFPVFGLIFFLLCCCVSFVSFFVCSCRIFFIHFFVAMNVILFWFSTLCSPTWFSSSLRKLLFFFKAVALQFKYTKTQPNIHAFTHTFISNVEFLTSIQIHVSVSLFLPFTFPF